MLPLFHQDITDRQKPWPHCILGSAVPRRMKTLENGGVHRDAAADGSQDLFVTRLNISDGVIQHGTVLRYGHQEANAHHMANGQLSKMAMTSWKRRQRIFNNYCPGDDDGAVKIPWEAQGGTTKSGFTRPLLFLWRSWQTRLREEQKMINREADAYSTNNMCPTSWTVSESMGCNLDNRANIIPRYIWGVGTVLAASLHGT